MSGDTSARSSHVTKLPAAGATTVRARRPRGEYAKSSARRSEILDAALSVFAESGYRAGSMREVSLRAGISEAGILHHYSSKAVLMEAVLDHRDERSRRFVDLDARDGAVALRGLVELARHNAGAPGVVALYCSLSAEATSPSHPAHAYFVRRYMWARESLGLAFERLAAEGRLRAGIDPRRAAVASLAFMDGLQVQWLLDRDVIDMPSELWDFFAALVDDFGRVDTASSATPVVGAR